MMMIPRNEGVTTTQIKTTYSSSAGTALVMYDDCKVLKLRFSFNELLRTLRAILGKAFLRDVRFVAAHRVASNMFLHTYRYDSVP